jgi:hypothetical protein
MTTGATVIVVPLQPPKKVKITVNADSEAKIAELFFIYSTFQISLRYLLYTETQKKCIPVCFYYQAELKRG